MFAVIYRSKLKPNCEELFKASWRTIANYFVAHHGAIGSCLHKTDDGYWITYSRWPSREARDAVWSSDDKKVSQPFPADIQAAVATLKDCIAEQEPDLTMEVVGDLLLSS